MYKMVCIFVGIFLEIGVGIKELVIIDELFVIKVWEGVGEMVFV